jgi:hypothetical protein
VSGWNALDRLGAIVRPIDEWPGQETLSRRSSPFSARLGDSIDLLARELRALGASRIVILAAFTERQLRLDGLPRSDANPAHPGLILTFESREQGPLKFPCDTFRYWQDNLRAIALGMEALRRVDRYGITKRGEQYTGWRQIAQRTGGFASVAQAEEYLERAWGGDVRRALLETHPDRGGDADEFQKVMSAKELIEA